MEGDPGELVCEFTNKKPIARTPAQALPARAQPNVFDQLVFATADFSTCAQSHRVLTLVDYVYE